MSLYFTKLAKATNQLSPRFESFQPNFLSLPMTSLDFNKIESSIFDAPRILSRVDLDILIVDSSAIANAVKNFTVFFEKKIPEKYLNLIDRLGMLDYSYLEDIFILGEIEPAIEKTIFGKKSLSRLQILPRKAGLKLSLR